jgi:Mg-chelatase subunit ChlD
MAIRKVSCTIIALLAICVVTIPTAAEELQRRPISLGVLVDTGSKMEPMIEMTKAGFDAFLQTLMPEDEVFLMGFGRTVSDLADITSDKAIVSRAFGRFLARGDSSLYQTLDVATKKLQEKGKHERKLLLVITAGQITAGDYARVADSIAKSKIVVHTLGVILNCGPCEVQPKEIAKRSGGSYGGLTRTGPDRYSIVPAFQALVNEIAKP